jgi:hypothetical protein
MRWWQHPLIPVTGGIVACFVYSLFPSSDASALIALMAWGVLVIVWMALGDRVH